MKGQPVMCQYKGCGKVATWRPVMLFWARNTPPWERREHNRAELDFGPAMWGVCDDCLECGRSDIPKTAQEPKTVELIKSIFGKMGRAAPDLKTAVWEWRKIEGSEP